MMAKLTQAINLVLRGVNLIVAVVAAVLLLGSLEMLVVTNRQFRSERP